MKDLGINIHSYSPLRYSFDDSNLDDGIQRDITVLCHMRESHEMIVQYMMQIRKYLPAGTSCSGLNIRDLCFQLV
jgi:hypothetical protein